MRFFKTKNTVKIKTGHWIGFKSVTGRYINRNASVCHGRAPALEDVELVYQLP